MTNNSKKISERGRRFFAMQKFIKRAKDSEIEKATQISRQYLCQVLNGKVKMPEIIARRLGDFFEVDWQEFMKEDEE